MNTEAMIVLKSGDEEVELPLEQHRRLHHVAEDAIDSAVISIGIVKEGVARVIQRDQRLRHELESTAAHAMMAFGSESIDRNHALRTTFAMIARVITDPTSLEKEILNTHIKAGEPVELLFQAVIGLAIAATEADLRSNRSSS